MSYNIIATGRFAKELKRLAKKFPSLKIEYKHLLAQISGKPGTGVSIGNNCFKIRLAINSKGKGKSGGGRIITYLYFATKTVYLLTMYDKSEKEDLKPNELKEIIDTLNLV